MALYSGDRTGALALLQTAVTMIVPEAADWSYIGAVKIGFAWDKASAFATGPTSTLLGNGGKFMDIEYAVPKSAPLQTRNYDLALPPGQAPRRVGMLANGFPDAEKYLAKQVAALEHLWPRATFRIDKKASADQLNIGIQEPLLSELSRDCDVMIIAWGHCGSCTSGVARDAIAFAERGIPSVMLVCEVFWEYSDWIGKALGMSNLAKVRLPFPIAGTGERAQRVCAERIAPEIVERLSRH